MPPVTFEIIVNRTVTGCLHAAESIYSDEAGQDLCSHCGKPRMM